MGAAIRESPGGGVLLIPGLPSQLFMTDVVYDTTNN